jgi:uncharacterized membrane protein
VRTDRGLDRLITFVDAVVAIAITLLVLPLVEVLRRPARDMDLAAVLAEDAAQFGAPSAVERKVGADVVSPDHHVW